MNHVASWRDVVVKGWIRKISFLKGRTNDDDEVGFLRILDPKIRVAISIVNSIQKKL